jgi:hypothetical protein
MTPKGQCRKFARLGSTVCKTHGGATKQVIEKARVRVEMASNKLMGKLIEFAFDDSKPPDTQLRAIQSALDRAGLRPPAEVVLSQGEPPKPWEEVYEGLTAMSRDESRRARGVPETEEIFAGLSSGSEGQSCNPPTQQDPADPNQPVDPRLRRESLDLTTDPRDSGRQRQPQRPQRHVTGDDAIRLANAANREIGALPPMRELTSPHKRYPHP